MDMLEQRFDSAASGAIAHLRGREKALEPLGWTGRRTEWIVLVCLRCGVFTRSLWARFMVAHPEQSRRGVHADRARLGRRGALPGIRGIGRVCRIHARSLLQGTRRGHPPPPRRLARRAHASPVFARLLDGARDLPWLRAEGEMRGKAQAGTPRAREHVEEADAAR